MYRNYIIIRKRRITVHNRKDLKLLRKKLRRNMTVPEITLWNALKGKQIGRKFRRQHSIGPFIVDFYCPSEHLVIELDGKSHFTASGIASDIERTKYLQKHGVSVLRFENKDIYDRLDSVLDEIKQHFSE